MYRIHQCAYISANDISLNVKSHHTNFQARCDGLCTTSSSRLNHVLTCSSTLYTVLYVNICYTLPLQWLCRIQQLQYTTSLRTGWWFNQSTVPMATVSPLTSNLWLLQNNLHKLLPPSLSTADIFRPWEGEHLQVRNGIKEDGLKGCKHSWQGKWKCRCFVKIVKVKSDIK